jgi:Na+/melibiose symporter-like transporter
MNPPERSEANTQNITALRSNIRDLGDQVDSYKAGTAGAMGAGVFLLLLALGGAYDLINHNNSLSSAIGISQVAFRWVAIAFGIAGAALVLLGLIRQWRRDQERESRLADMEQELARLESDIRAAR